MNRIITFFTTSKVPGTIVAPHTHSCCEFVYYLNGFGKTTIGEEQHSFRSGSFALIRPQIPHGEIHHQAADILCICFSTQADIPQGVYQDGSRRTFGKIAECILWEGRMQKYGFESMMELKLAELLIEIARLSQSDARHKDLGYAVRFIDENYSAKIILSELADTCGYGYDRFHHLFKEQTGLSPRQYLLHKRLSCAKQLLKSTRMNCTEIAYACGFSNSAQFSLLFKKAFGVPPSSWQKQNRSI